MIALMSPSWSGLPLFRCGHDEEVRHLDIDIDTPRLVLWNSGGTEVLLRGGCSRCRQYRARPGRFDFYAAESFDEIRVGPMLDEALVAEVPAEWMPRGNVRLRTLDKSRFQFGDGTLKALLNELLVHAAQGEPMGSLYTQTLSLAIASRLFELDKAPRSRKTGPLLAPTRRRSIDELLDAHLDDPPDVAALAQVAGMSERKFLRAFKEAFGDSLHQVVLQRRIERAKALLVSDGASLTALALDLGFASHAHFTAAFHARTGTTPSAFRHAQPAGGTDEIPREARALRDAWRHPHSRGRGNGELT